jgi:hypothetical protein
MVLHDKRDKFKPLHLEFDEAPMPLPHSRAAGARIEMEAAILMLEPGFSLLLERHYTTIYRTVKRIRAQPEFAQRRFHVKRQSRDTCRIWRLE